MALGVSFAGGRRVGCSALLVALVASKGFFELILKNDDPAGRGQVGALVAHLSGARGEA